MTTATTPAFRGWWRPNRRTAWTKLAEGPDYATALDRLIEAVARVRGGDSVVLRACEDPNGPARPFHAGGRRRL